MIGDPRNAFSFTGCVRWWHEAVRNTGLSDQTQWNQAFSGRGILGLPACHSLSVLCRCTLWQGRGRQATRTRTVTTTKARYCGPCLRRADMPCNRRSVWPFSCLTDWLASTCHVVAVVVVAEQ
jgi:hypothetical protein